VRRLATWPAVGTLLQEAYGKKPFCFQTLNFQLGTEQATHSDTIHFNSDPAGYMCGVWVALEDMDEDNGPLEYYPYSQLLPEYTFDHIPNRDYGSYERFLADKIKEQNMKPEHGLLKKGEALLWTANLWHGGSPIKDKTRTRYSQVSHYFFDDCVYYTPMHSSDSHRTFRNPHRMYFS
jgi:ectoine hydroxylase-related dioxygenase (phytanoyl-CoA dioxygenase family)